MKMKKTIAALSAGVLLAAAACPVSQVSAAIMGDYDLNSQAYIDYVNELGERAEDEPVSSIFIPIPYYGEQHMEFNSPQYRKFLKNLKLVDPEIVKEYLIDKRARNFYVSRSGVCYLERGNSEIRTFIEYHIGRFDYYENEFNFKTDEINNFLQENNYKVFVEEKINAYNDIGFCVKTEDECTPFKFSEAMLALYEKYKFPLMLVLYESGGSYITFKEINTDINGDGVFGIADVVLLQKALSTSTVTSDMDINEDGKVNVFDLVAIKRMISVRSGDM